MRVAVVSPYALDRPGGVQGQAIELARRLSEAGHRAWLVAPASGPSSVPGAHLVGRPVGIRMNRSVAPVSVDPRSGRRTVAAITGADLVHIHEPFVPLVSLSAVLGSGGAPRVGTFHAAPGRTVGATYRLVGPFLRRLGSRLAGTTAVSEVAAAPARGLGLAPAIVPNALDTSRFSSEPGRPGRVLFVGRNEPRKGLAVLLRAWPSVLEAVPGAELVVLGSTGPPIEGARFLGRVPEDRKRAELAEASILCAPNQGHESFGVVLVEGMASGCALVASDLPGFVETLDGAGRLVPPGDPVVLAEALVELLRDPGQADELRRRGLARARRFDWEAVLPRYLELYDRVLA